MVAAQKPHRARLYVWDADGRTAPQPISDEGTFGRPSVSPDGAWVAAGREGSPPSLYPTAGGAPRTVPGSGPDDRALGWSADGKWLFVRHLTNTRTVALIERLEVATGRRSRWKEVRPSERVGLFDISDVLITPDGRGHAYSFASALGTLYLVEGLK
jgi:Tol biopolymer transport system component